MAILAIVVLVVIAAVAWYAWQRRRTAELRARYGPEYTRTVGQLGDRRRAEAELVARQERVEQLDIRALTVEQRRDFLGRWRGVQARFVDDPKGAVTDADHLVDEVMVARGYPLGDFDRRAADLSVHHPRVVENYRAARDIALRHRRGEASTEDLRRAMVYYRELFQDLLEDREHEGEHEAGRAADRPVSRAVEREQRLEVERDVRQTDDRGATTNREVNP
ncbi:MAG TPA: hypothetical protein VF488_04220 [Gemmatimonadaceae bacterium]